MPASPRIAVNASNGAHARWTSALRAGIAAWIALILLQPVWYLAWAPPANDERLLALAFALPALLAPLPVLRTSPRRALLWAGIAALFYFCHGVVCAWVTPSMRMPALVEVALCLAIIAAIGADWRQRKRART